MSVLSVSCCALLSAICAVVLVNASGCGTDAKGVDDCRDIQNATCVAAKSCGTISDVDACKRYYRDDCLHGLPVASPGSTQVKACIAAITNAGTCASQAEAGSDPPLSQCTSTIDTSSATTACDIVRQPELATDCAFLAPSTANAGSGGESAGSGGDSAAGGTSGAAGSDDAP